MLTGPVVNSLSVSDQSSRLTASAPSISSYTVLLEKAKNLLVKELAFSEGRDEDEIELQIQEIFED